MKMKKTYAAALAAALVLTAGFSVSAVDLTLKGTVDYDVDAGDLVTTVTASGEDVAASLEGQSANLHDVTVSSIQTNNGAQLNGGANIHNGANVYVKPGDENALTVNGGALTVNGGGFVVNKITEAEDGSLVPGETVYKVDGEGNITGNSAEIKGNINTDTIVATSGGTIGNVTMVNGTINSYDAQGNRDLYYDGEGNLYADGTVTGKTGKFDSITMGTGANTILLNGTTGQIVANSMGANQIATKKLSAGNGIVTVDEEGNLSAGNGDVTVSAAGEVSMKNGSGELVSLTDSNGLTMSSAGDYGTGMLKLDNGRVSLMGGTMTTVTVDGSGTTFGMLFGDAKTVINGDTITTGEVTGLKNTEWTGATDDESRAATEGQLADLNETLSGSIETATQGVVKWDNLDEDAGQIKGVTFEGDGDLTAADLTADTISAMNGNFNVNEEGIRFRTEDAADLTTYHYYFDMNNENGISFGHSNGASMSLNENGVTFAYGDKTTHINGDEIFTGTVHADLVQASDMYRGDANNPDNQVVTKGELDKTIEGVTNSSVQWDDPQSKDSINGVGLKDGKNGNTGIGGNLDVAGDLTIKDGQGGYINVGDSITSIKDSIADVNGDISKVKADVAQNKEDISGIKDQIGSETLKTTSQTLTGAINENHNAIQTNKEAIGDVSALKGQDANGNKYTNLTDAVNGNYDAIQQTQTQVQQNTNAISSLSSQVNDLGGEIDNVGAISAALAGLHPLDYDGTGSKFQLAAAMGSYDGSQAAAIGGFYHFNEDVMMSVGGATAFDGDKKTAFNVGVSFRVGQGSSGKKVNSDDVLAQLNAMNEKIAARGP